MQNKPKTLVVNFLGGPGCGKSSMAASVFAQLKWKGVESEIVIEFAKELVWGHSQKTLENQIHVFGEQHHRVHRLLGNVDVILTDSPIILSPIYDVEKRETFKQLVLEEFNRNHNLNIFINRKKKYNPKGRNQDEEGARKVDEMVKTFMNENLLSYLDFDGVPESVPLIVETIQNYESTIRRIPV
jgi:AAA domain